MFMDAFGQCDGQHTMPNYLFKIETSTGKIALTFKRSNSVFNNSIYLLGKCLCVHLLLGLFLPKFSKRNWRIL